MRLLAAAATLLAVPAALALPVQVDAEYSVSAAGVPIGRVTETFRRDGDA